MKRYLTPFILFILLPTIGRAQNLWVYSFNGSVETNSSKEWRPAEIYQSLSLSDSIKMGAYSSISILDRKNERIYAIQKDGVNSVPDLIKEAGTRNKKQSRSVISYLWGSFAGKNDVGDYSNSAGVVYRNSDINAAMAYAIENLSGSIPVEFALIDRGTGYSIGELALVGNTAVILVKNHSNLDVFVNIIDIDACGGIAPCIPVSSAQSMTQLLIPANSQVLLDSFPIVFAEPRGEDKLILIASPEWFDVNAVVKALKEKQFQVNTSIKAGVFKQRLMVK